MILAFRWLIVPALLLVRAQGSPPPSVPLDDVAVESKFRPKECVRAAEPGDFVRYHYLGTFPGGGQFDSSYDRGSTYDVFVGKGRLIAGMDKALIGMCVNERRFIKVPPHLAYGDEGMSDKIPPDATLFFDVLMLDIWNPEDKVKIEVHYKPENCSRIVQVSDFVRYHYNGTLLDGTFFDSSHTRQQTYDTYVGIGWLIPGMDEGLLGMCMGEKRTITIPPFLGYGIRGDGKDIPSQATLVFQVTLVDFHNPKDSVAIEQEFVPDPCLRKTKKGDFVRYHYNGTLMDGTLFDSSYSRNHTYNTYIGKGYIIAGMEEGLLDVCVGEKRTIIIPPHLGYGEEGISGSIPGSAVLIFHIHMIDVHNPADTIEIQTYHKPSNCTVLSKKGDYIKYHYNATLMDGTKLDSTHNYGKTYNVVLGSGQVVIGMDMGLTNMCVEEKRTIIIPPHLGYGESGIVGEVPGSAVLIFDVELVELVAGLPEGYMFVWTSSELSPDLFQEIDKDENKEIGLEEFSEYILLQVESGKGKLAPGFPPDKVIENMFITQDRNGDSKISADEFKLKEEEDTHHDEL
ncbi:peptidyl-prolyl cis-trans isomerase FKBP9 [Rhincodon typus]|uniref:peptidyl-prolyl cis-trans isomerase FKBP9 n=1 Tax=Rhincodon typus TaxID=259920 RepID=UPI0009A2A6A4|nr:peptidyl-prolyl cis-trans isomerase FKBP9 [Rhincodon typus]